MTFPHIDPVIFSIGPLAVRWYGMMYLLSFIGAYFMLGHIVRLHELPIKKDTLSDLLFYSILGVVLGGRFGYALFYNFSYYVKHPLQILYIWEGGMSFHGGFLGVLIVLLVFCWRQKMALLQISDLVVAVVPIGLGLGRIGNFINAELWGRVTEHPWGIIFPGGSHLPRHPSQLYEAVLEGLVLFVLIYALHRVGVRRGIPTFIFILFYGLFRFLVEFVRQPDEHLGFLWAGASMGQLLSVPMIVFGFGGLIYILKRGRA